MASVLGLKHEILRGELPMDSGRYIYIFFVWRILKLNSSILEPVHFTLGQLIQRYFPLWEASEVKLVYTDEKKCGKGRQTERTTLVGVV
jgi:hypothetical protein